MSAYKSPPVYEVGEAILKLLGIPLCNETAPITKFVVTCDYNEGVPRVEVTRYALHMSCEPITEKFRVERIEEPEKPVQSVSEKMAEASIDLKALPDWLIAPKDNKQLSADVLSARLEQLIKGSSNPGKHIIIDKAIDDVKFLSGNTTEMDWGRGSVPKEGEIREFSAVKTLIPPLFFPSEIEESCRKSLLVDQSFATEITMVRCMACNGVGKYVGLNCIESCVECGGTGRGKP